MAEVENMPAATAAAADIPKVSSSDVGTAELGTSPAQERSSNSHPHDSEYDTASDLEGGEHDDYDEDDDDEDDDGESISDDEDDDDDDEDEEDDDEERQRGQEAGQDKVDEMQKKVDEDRSNPQYIPKRGTFYEHDDRTAEGAEGAPTQTIDLAEVNEVGGANPQSPAISHASKTMKNWQPASGVDRWSHDRFEASEQAPKSRSELVSAYGYDIRNEDAPPRARRRRRYGRGPGKYSRNWEDETAYLKASNIQRKPPRPSDFPALNERTRPRKSNSVREEKENHLERRQVAAGEKLNNSSSIPQHTSRSGERNERDTQRKGNKNKTYGRNPPVGHQAAMEFKNKQRANQSQMSSSSQQHSSQGNRLDQQHERSNNRAQNSHNSQINDHQRTPSKPQSQSKNSQSQNEIHNATPDQGYIQMQNPHLAGHSPNQSSRQITKSTPTSNLSARLQQVQNRNDPSHVGSVQMHALANQNQLVGQQQQASIMLAQQQQQITVSAAANHQDQGRPKRYSSIRRSQHDTQNMDPQQHQIQQLHLQQQQQQVAAQPLILQDQHLLQANLMQLYHQENIQAQMQALQVSAGLQATAPPQQAGQQKGSAYGTVPAPTQQQPQPQQYAANPGAGTTPTAYYVTAADAYTANAATAQPPQTAQYAQQPTNYLQSTTAATGAPPLTYTSPPPPQQAVGANATVSAAGPLAYVGANNVPSGTQTAPSAVPPTVGQPGYQNYTNYQNYNTVGGTTYFVPPAQTTSRPVVLPQRRPTNAIPILPPSEKSKQRSQLELKEETLVKNNSNNVSSSTTTATAPIGSADNIDHIIDNMFVQRPAYQPPPAQARKSSSPQSEGTAAVGTDSNLATTPVQSVSNTSQTEEVEKPSNTEADTESNNAVAANEAI